MSLSTPSVLAAGRVGAGFPAAALCIGAPAGPEPLDESMPAHAHGADRDTQGARDSGVLESAGPEAGDMDLIAREVETSEEPGIRRLGGGIGAGLGGGEIPPEPALLQRCAVDGVGRRGVDLGVHCGASAGRIPVICSISAASVP